MRVAVFGGGGFIGRPLAARLRQDGHEPWIVSRRRQACEQSTHLDELDSESVQAVLEAVSADLVINLIWVTAHGTFWESPENARYVEFSETLTAAAAAAGVSRVVGTGTGAEYGGTSDCYSALAAYPPPDTVYGQSKLLAGRALIAKAEAKGMTAAWARIFQVYGPGQQGRTLLNIVREDSTRGCATTLNSPFAVRDWIHVDDVAAALASLGTSDRHGVFNIGTGIGRSAMDVATVAATTLGSPRPVAKRHEDGDAGRDRVVACQDETLVLNPKRKPMTVEEGVAATYRADVDRG